MFEGNSVNNPDIGSQSRSPRGIVKINNIQVPFVTVEVDQTNFYMASTFRMSIPIGTLPKELNLSYFSSTPAILVEIYAGFPSNPLTVNEGELTKLLVAQVDDVKIPMPLTVIQLSGRDLTAKFIDNKTTEKFQNHTSSQIVKILAARRGMTADVTDTHTIVGKYYQIDHVSLSDETTEWDLLTFLAKEEGFNVYVEDQTLHFHPLPKETDKPYVLKYSIDQLGRHTSNVISGDLSRNLTIAKDVIVKVRSWNMKRKKGFTVTVKATHNKNTVLAGAAQPIGDAQVFTYRFANLSKQQALDKAQKLLKKISSHEMNLSANLAPDNILSNRNITRTLTPGGYTMSLDAKNHQPNTETTL
jgi:hypothetical protein